MAVEMSDRNLQQSWIVATSMMRGDFYRQVLAAADRQEGINAKGVFMVAAFAGLQNLGVEDSKQIPLVKKAFQEWNEMETAEIRLSDVIIAQQIVVELQRRGSNDFLQSVDAVLDGIDGFNARGPLLMGVLAELHVAGVDEDKQIPFVTIGLASLGVAVSDN